PGRAATRGDRRTEGRMMEIVDLRAAVKRWRTDEWHRQTKKSRGPKPDGNASDGILRCAWVLVRAYRGDHHVPRAHVRDHYIEVLAHGGLSTFDFDVLTRLTVFAHDAAVRVEIQPCMRYLRILLHPRVRTGNIMHRHPTLEEHAAAMRGTIACP